MATLKPRNRKFSAKIISHLAHITRPIRLELARYTTDDPAKLGHPSHKENFAPSWEYSLYVCTELQKYCRSPQQETEKELA